MSAPRHLLTAVLLLATAAGAWGCGGPGDATFRTDRPIVRFILDEYRIGPQDVTVSAGGRLKIVARNTGRLTHNLAVQRETDSIDDEVVELNRTDTIQPGRTADPIKVDLEPGDYRLVCTIANHDDLGQFGELHVED